MYPLVLCVYGVLIILLIINIISPRVKLSFGMVCFTIVVLLSCITIAYEPEKKDDLYRLYQELEIIKNSGTLVSDNGEYSLWLLNLFYRFVTMFHFKQALPVISIALGLGLIFSSYNLYVNKFKIPIWASMMGLYFFLGTWDYFNAASGIRWSLACAVAFFILNFDLCENHNTLLCIGGYIVLAFFHIGMLLIVAIRIIVLIIDKSSKIAKKIVYCTLILYALFLQGLLEILQMLPNNVFKAMLFSKISSVFWNMSQIGQLKRIYLKLPLAISVLFILVVFKTYFSARHKEWNRYVEFCLCLTLFAIGSLYYYDLFMRMMTFVYIAVIPIYWMLLISYREGNIAKRKSSIKMAKVSTGVAQLMVTANLVYFVVTQYAHFDPNI